MGSDTVASGETSTAMGYTTVAEGNSSTAMGYKTQVGLFKTINDAVDGITDAAEAIVNAPVVDGVTEWEDELGVVYEHAARQLVSVRDLCDTAIFANHFTNSSVLGLFTDVRTLSDIAPLLPSFPIDAAAAAAALTNFITDCTNFITDCDDVKTKITNLSEDAVKLISGDNGLAAGNLTVAYAKDSTAMGLSTAASGLASTAMGYKTKASGPKSTAMGELTGASGKTSTAMGFITGAEGDYSTAMGWGTKASGFSSTAMGQGTKAEGPMSTAMGCDTLASDNTSTAMGQNTKASGQASTAMGSYTVASGFSSTAMGQGTKAEGHQSTAMGDKTRVGLLKTINDQVGGILAAAELLQTHYATVDTVEGRDDQAEWLTTLNALKVGYDAAISTFNPMKTLCTNAKPKFSDADVLALFDAVIALNPPQVDLDITPDADAADALNLFIGACMAVLPIPPDVKKLISGEYGLATGNMTVAYAKDSTAMGAGTAASGQTSTAMGNYTRASGQTSTAMGSDTAASGNSSTAMGFSTVASGANSTAMGYYTIASGETSTAMGNYTAASGETSTAMGYTTVADGRFSTAMGTNTRVGLLNTITDALGGIKTAYEQPSDRLKYDTALGVLNAHAASVCVDSDIVVAIAGGGGSTTRRPLWR